MRHRDPEKAILILDAMLEFFDGGKRWTQDMLSDASGQHRCLIGALRHARQQQRIREDGTAFYLRVAWIAPDLADKLMSLALPAWDGLSDPDDGDLMIYNDVCDSYDEVRKLIVTARAIAQAELDAKRPQIPKRINRHGERQGEQHARDADADEYFSAR
jgi:hypothetical protein